MEVSK